MKFLINKCAVLGVIAVMATAAAVQAVPITGSVSMQGLATLDNSDLSQATTVESWNNVYVDSDNGAFSSIALDVYNVSLSSPWVFNPYTPPPAFTWTVGGFTFTMLSDTVTVTPGISLDVLGYGTITSTNSAFDPTSYYWNFSTQVPPGGGDTVQFNFSSYTEEVPDGGLTVALLGLAFAGVEGLRRKLIK
jgi:hypothetical protein